MSDSIIPTRKCTKCGKEFPATREYFRRDIKGKYGLSSRCIKCKNAENREWAENNTEKVKKINRRWAADNREKVREKSRKIYNNDPEKKRKSNRRWEKNNPKKVREKHLRWMSSHPGKKKEIYREWVKNNPDKVKVINRNYRARKMNNGGTHTATDIQKQLQDQKGKCYYCDCKLKKKYHVDHVIPLVRGGGNDPSNLVCACARCNLSKNAKTLREWIETINDSQLYIRVAQRIVERKGMK